MTPPRRAKLVLLVLAVAIVGLGVWQGENLYWWATTYRKWRDSEDPFRGWARYDRWGDYKDQRHGITRMWHPSTGYLGSEVVFEDGAPLTGTVWRTDGTIEMQYWDAKGKDNEKRSGPWWWDVTDQTEPSIPEWMKDDAQWQAALDAQE